MRLFVAVDAGEEVRKNLGRKIELLERTGAGVKWVPLENIHITLKFLGNTSIPPARIVSALQTVKMSAFTAEAGNVGAFPSPNQPRVVFGGITAGGAEMEKLAEMVEKALEPLGFSPEIRKFHPHLTIGRVKSPKNLEKLIKILFAQEPSIFGKISVVRFLLMESETRHGGPVYKKIAEIPLD